MGSNLMLVYRESIIPPSCASSHDCFLLQHHWHVPYRPRLYPRPPCHHQRLWLAVQILGLPKRQKLVCSSYRVCQLHVLCDQAFHPLHQEGVQYCVVGSIDPMRSMPARKRCYPLRLRVNQWNRTDLRPISTNKGGVHFTYLGTHREPGRFGGLGIINWYSNRLRIARCSLCQIVTRV